MRRLIMGLLFTVLVLSIPPLGLLPIFPAFWAFDQLDIWMGAAADGDHALYLAAIPLFAWPAAFIMVLVTVAFIVVFRWLVLPRVREGTYSTWSFFYLRKWAVALATEITLETLSSLFATLYMRAWYRLMGAKIGKDSEISTNLAGRYDLVEIGDKCFIADEVVLGDEDVRRGWMYLKHVKTGERVFIGNDAVVPPGAEIPDWRADRHQVEAAGQQRIGGGRHLVRVAANQAAGAAKIRRRRRLDLSAAALEKVDARLLRGDEHLAAAHAVHHLRDLGGGELRPAAG